MKTLKVALMSVALAATLSGCAVVQIDENLEGLRGKYILLYVPDTTEDTSRFCSKEMNLPLSAACVMIAPTDESARAAFKGFVESGDRLDCIIAAPATNSLIMHELTRCATGAKDYWNTSTIKPSNVRLGVQR